MLSALSPLHRRTAFAILPLCACLASCSNGTSTTAGAGGAGASATSAAGSPTSSTSTGATSAVTSSTGTNSTGSTSTGSTGSTATATSSTGTGGGDPVVSSLVYVGCNRIQKADWVQSSDPSSANLPQLQQTFADVTALATPPRYFFFTGDLVLGLNTDTTLLSGQLDAWAQVYQTDPSQIVSKVPLIPLVGNHEMLAKVTLNIGKVEISNPGSDAIWTSFIGANGFDTHAGNGPTPAGANADKLQDDQSRFTYSFDDGPIHYVVLNTDTWTTEPDPSTGSTQIGWIAMQWLGADLAAAEANPAVKHIAIFGHKPAISPAGGTTSADVINPAFTTAFESLLDQTTKVRGYFAAHAHLWDARKLPGQRGVYQVVAGNGGSQLETAWPSPFYGFTEVRFYQSGKVGVVSWQRPVPATYDLPPATPAQAQAELVISP